MALHGEIKVNHEIVGMWEARRTKVQREQTNVYECRFQRLVDGQWQFVDFRLAHFYDDGAAFLAQKVIQIGNDYLNGKKDR